jgi:hypothetical protein
MAQPWVAKAHCAAPRRAAANFELRACLPICLRRLSALGVKVGHQAWISELQRIREPDLLEIGEKVTLCSGNYFHCSTFARAGRVILQPRCTISNVVSWNLLLYVVHGALRGPQASCDWRGSSPVNR